MSVIKWENLSNSEIRAEVEAALESTGENKKIRQSIEKNNEIKAWRDQVSALCKQIIEEKGPEEVTPDMLYDNIVFKARELMPPSISNDIIAKLTTFLQEKFEDST